MHAGVMIITAWYTHNETITVTVTHEYPLRPDIVPQAADYDLPSCVTPSEVVSTQHELTAKVDANCRTVWKLSCVDGYHLSPQRKMISTAIQQCCLSHLFTNWEVITFKIAV